MLINLQSAEDLPFYGSFLTFEVGRDSVKIKRRPKC